MNDSFQQDISHPMTLTQTHNDMDYHPLSLASEDIKSIFNNLIEDDRIKEAIYKDFNEIIRNVMFPEEKNRLVIEHCTKYEHISYQGTNHILVLETKLGSPCFCLTIEEEQHQKQCAGLGRRKLEMNTQETLNIIHKVCEEKMTQESKTDADRILEKIKYLRAEYESLLQQNSEKKEQFEGVAHRYQEVKSKHNYVEKEVGNVLVNMSASLTEKSVPKSATNENNASTEDENDLPDELKIQRNEYKCAKDDFEICDAKLSSLRKNIQLLEELYALALAGNLDRSSNVPWNVFELNQSSQKEQNPVKAIPVEVLLKDFEMNSYHSFFSQNQNIIIEKEDVESQYSLSLTEFSKRGEDQIENLEQEIERKKEQLIPREATSKENEGFVEMIKQGTDVEEIKEYMEGVEVNLLYKDKEKGSTALHYAAIYPEIFKLLFEPLSHKEKLEFILGNNKEGETVLHFTAKGNEIDMCKLLLNLLSDDEKSKYISEQDKQGSTALHKAAQNGKFAICKYLINSLPESKKTEYILQKDLNGHSALTYAFKSQLDNLVHDQSEKMQRKEKDKLLFPLLMEKNIFESKFHQITVSEQIEKFTDLLNSFPNNNILHSLLNKNREDIVLEIYTTEDFKDDVFYFLYEDLSAENKEEIIAGINKSNIMTLHYVLWFQYEYISRTLTDLTQENAARQDEHLIDMNDLKNIHIFSIRRVYNLLKFLQQNNKEENGQSYEDKIASCKILLSGNIDICNYLISFLSEAQKEQFIIVEDQNREFKAQSTSINEQKLNCVSEAFVDNILNIITVDQNGGLENMEERKQSDSLIDIPNNSSDPSEIEEQSLFEEHISFDFFDTEDLRKKLEKRNERLDTLLRMQHEKIPLTEEDYPRLMEIIHGDDENRLRRFIGNYDIYRFKERDKQRTILHLIASDGKLEFCQILLDSISEDKKDEYILKKDKDGNNTLYHARNNMEKCRFLINALTQEKRADLIVHKNKEGKTVKDYAMSDLFEFLLESLPEEKRISFILQTDKDGNTVLQKLVNDEEKCRLVVNSLPQDRRAECILNKNNNGETVLDNIRNKLFEFLVEALPEESRILLLRRKDSNGNTALHKAAADLETCKLLVALLPQEDRPELIFQKNNNGETLLHLIRYEKFLFELLFNALSPESKTQLILDKDSNGNTALYYSINDVEKCKFLVNLLPKEKRTELILHKNNDDKTVLDYKIKTNLFEFLIESLSEEGRMLFMAQRDGHGNNPLYHVRYELEKCKFLVNALPKEKRTELILHKNNDDETVLDYYIKTNLFQSPVTSRLLEENKIECVSEKEAHQNNAPPYKAVEIGNFEIWEYLVNLLPGDKKIASIIEQNKLDQTAILFGLQLETMEICLFLLDQLPLEQRRKLI